MDILGYAITFSFIVHLSLQPEVKYTQCSKDEDCTPGQYCILDRQLCANCIDCQNGYNKAPLEKELCAKQPEECGSCLPGYESRNLTDKQNTSDCSKIPIANQSTSLDSPALTTDGSWGLFVVLPILIIIAFGGILWKFREKICIPVKNENHSVTYRGPASTTDAEPTVDGPLLSGITTET